jgi:hypothetical protein
MGIGSAHVLNSGYMVQAGQAPYPGQAAAWDRGSTVPAAFQSTPSVPVQMMSTREKPTERFDFVTDMISQATEPAVNRNV